MKALETTIKKNGFTYTQIKRNERAALYEQATATGTVIGYEVFRIRSHNGYTLAGQTFPPAEMFPNNEAFGTWAWAYRPASEWGGVPVRAEAKYRELTEVPELQSEDGQETIISPADEYSDAEESSAA